jgi:hypothetical protein
MCNVRFNTKRQPNAPPVPLLAPAPRTRSAGLTHGRRAVPFYQLQAHWSTVEHACMQNNQVGTIDCTTDSNQLQINIAHPSHRPPPAVQRVRPAQGRWGCTSPLLRHTPLLTESQCVTWEHASRGVSRSGGCMPSLLARRTSGGNGSIGETDMEWAPHSHRRKVVDCSCCSHQPKGDQLSGSVVRCALVDSICGHVLADARGSMRLAAFAHFNTPLLDQGQRVDNCTSS